MIAEFLGWKKKDSKKGERQTEKLNATIGALELIELGVMTPAAFAGLGSRRWA